MQNMINKFSNMPNISGIFNNSYYLNASVKCGSRVVDFSNAYMSCRNVKGPAVCGDNVTNMAYSYCYCPKITGAPVCGPKVINMSNTYRQCYNLTGAPVCGANVTDFTSTYMSCSNLPGPAVCGPKVTNMYQTYRSCENLIGAPACGDNVTDMSASYLWCKNMQGYTSIGPKVTNMYQAFQWCGNLRGDCIIYSNNVTNMTDAFSQRNEYRQLRIFVPKGTTTNTTAMQLTCTGDTSGWANWEQGNHRHHWDSNTSIITCERTSNLIAVYRTHTDFFVPRIITNTSSNYINYVAVVKKLGDTTTVTNYSGAQIANKILGIASISEPTIINLSDSFNKEPSDRAIQITEYRVEIYKNDSNVKVTGFDFYNKIDDPTIYSSYLNILYLDHSLTDISNLCSGISYANGDGWSGPNVTNMTYAYSHANIDGCPECGHKVIDFSHAYQRCVNLVGPAVCGPNVTNMYMSYDGCFELAGKAACGPKVTDMFRAYQQTNVTTGVIGPSVTNSDCAYSGCMNMKNVSLQNGLTKIGRETFASCTNLVSATIPSTVTNIGPNAFNYCTNIMLFRYLYRTTVPTLGANAFDYCGGDSEIGLCYHFVPKDMLNTWKNSWSTVVPSGRIKPINSALAPYSDTIPDSATVSVGDTITMTWYVLNYGQMPTCSVKTDSGTSTYYSLSSVTVEEVGDYAWKCTFTITGKSKGSEYFTMKSTGTSSGGVNGFSYSSSIQVHVKQPTGTYSVSSAGASYQFALNSNGYYESNNKGVPSSAAVSKVVINNPDGNEVIFQCINYAESSFDYGYLSVVNQAFGTSTSDSSSLIYHNFKGKSSSAIQEVSYGRITSGTIYVKFRKDSSDDRNNDSLQFKVAFRN